MILQNDITTEIGLRVLSRRYRKSGVWQSNQRIQGVLFERQFNVWVRRSDKRANIQLTPEGKHCNSECEGSLSRAERVESTNRTWALKRHDEAAGKPRSDHA
jgi:hypothetical protein